MAANSPKFLLPDSQLLCRNNYFAWKTKLKTQLEFEEVWNVVSGTTTRHPSNADEQKKFDQADGKAKLIMMFSVFDEVQPFI